MISGTRPRGREALAATAAAVLAALLSLALFGCGPADRGRADVAFERAEVVRVVDGDTILADAGDGSFYVRLASIDAPESVHPDEGRNVHEGKLASDHLKGIVSPGDAVYLQRDASDEDAYGRAVRYVWSEVPADAFDAEEVSAKMLNAVMVRDGFARSTRFEPDVLYSDVLDELQSEAASAGRGVTYLWR